MFSPDDYANNPGRKSVTSSFIPKIMNSMSWDFEQGCVLDYGCGPGTTGYELILPKVMDTKSSLYSVDMSPKMIEYARRHLPHPRITYETGHFPDNFPLTDLKFDKIFAINVFHFLKQITPTLNGIKRVMKPGGELGFTMTTANFPIIKTLNMWAHSDKWSEYLSTCRDFMPVWADYKDNSPEEHFRDIFVRGTGLHEVLLKFVNVKVPTTMTALIDICMSMNPCLDKVPQSLHPELRQEYREIMAQMIQVPVDKEQLEVPLEAVYGVLKKKVDA